MRRSISLALALAVMLLGHAHAQTAWPVKPIRLIVGFAAGGSTDVTARIIAQALSERLGQPVVVENRGGAGGNIGADAVAKADPDGYTLLMATSSTFAANPNLYKTLPFDVQKDFAPIAVTAFIPNLLVVNPSVPANNVADFIAYLKANPDKLSYASSGVGQSPHLTGAWFLQLTGLKMTHIPFRGAGPALQAALAGDIQILFDNLYPSLPQVQNGTLTGLCVTTAERSDLAPNLPTMRESAPELANFDVSSWFSVFLPKGVPAPVLEALNLQVKAMLERDDIKKNIAAMGARADYGTPQQFSDFLDAETKKFAGIIQKEGLQMDVQ